MLLVLPPTPAFFFLFRIWAKGVKFVRNNKAGFHLKLRKPLKSKQFTVLPKELAGCVISKCTLVEVGNAPGARQGRGDPGRRGSGFWSGGGGQFSSVQSLSRVWLFGTPWPEGRQASVSVTSSRGLLKLMSIESVMPSNHLILCHPVLLCLQSRLWEADILEYNYC